MPAVLEHLGAARVRHGTRATEDEALVAELAGPAVMLDVCSTSSLRTGVVRDLLAHPWSP